MRNRETRILILISLAIELTGVCNGAWALASIDVKFRGFKRDEACIVTDEEREAKNMGNDYEKLQVGPGSVPKLPACVDDAPKSLI